MPHEVAAAFVRGAVRSSATEPWKATVRFPARIGINYPPAHRHHFASIHSASPADAVHHRRNLTVSIYRPEHASGRRHPNSLPTDNPHSRRFLVVAPSLAEKAWKHEGGAYFKPSATFLRADSSPYPVNSRPSLSCRALMGRTTGPGTRKDLPRLGRIVKISLLCLVLHKMGLLVSRPTVDKKKAGLNMVLLWLGLFAGYMAIKDNHKVASVLKVCDGGMKVYKVLTEIVDILSTFFK